MKKGWKEREVFESMADLSDRAWEVASVRGTPPRWAHSCPREALPRESSPGPSRLGPAPGCKTP